MLGAEGMNEKRKIILKEIEYWRKNKVLPEQYCDFLTALYTEGSENYLRPTSGGLKKHFPKILFAVAVLLAIGSVILLGYYFNDFPLQLQMALLCFLVFIAGIFLKWFYVQFVALFLLTCFIAWYSLPYLEENFSWIVFEGSWLGVSLLMLFGAWAIRHMLIQLSLNLFIHGILLLFVPIIQGMFIDSINMDLLLILLFSKLIFVAIFLFVSRRMLDAYIRIFSS